MADQKSPGPKTVDPAVPGTAIPSRKKNINIFSALSRRQTSGITKVALLRMLSQALCRKKADGVTPMDKSDLFSRLSEITSPDDLAAISKTLAGGSLLHELVTIDISHITNQNQDMLRQFYEVLIDLYCSADGSLEKLLAYRGEDITAASFALKQKAYLLAETLFTKGAFVKPSEILENLGSVHEDYASFPTMALWIAIDNADYRFILAKTDDKAEAESVQKTGWELAIEYALKEGAKLSSKGLVQLASDSNLLMHAAFSNLDAVVQIFKDYIDPNEHDSHGFNAFYYALYQCDSENVDCLKTLVYRNNKAGEIDSNFKINAVIDKNTENTLIHELMVTLLAKEHLDDNGIIIIDLIKDLLFKNQDFNFTQRNKAGQSVSDLALEFLQKHRQTESIDLITCIEKAAAKHQAKALTTTSAQAASAVGFLAKKTSKAADTSFDNSSDLSSTKPE